MPSEPRRVHTLPTLRRLTAELRQLNANMDGPGTFGFACEDWDGLGACWRVIACDEGWPTCGSEEIPGDGDPKFDPVGAARRLLAAARDEGGRSNTNG